MVNNSKMSKSASIEDLKEKNSQLEAEVLKLSGEVQEVLNRQEESPRHMEDNRRAVEESQRRMEENSRAIEDKLGNLSLMMEKTLRQISSKHSIPIIGDSSNGNKPNGDNNSRIKGKGIPFGVEDEGIEPEFDMNSEEINWANDVIKERDKSVRNEHRRGGNIPFPRMEFPRFDGSDPRMWRINCEYYFEMYEVPEVYKSRMTVMNFSDEVHEWYRCLTKGKHQLPWELLADEVVEMFQLTSDRDPVDEFKRTHQIWRVEEFIKRFDRVRSRLLNEKPHLDEGFFVSGFISGLKEELRHTVELFCPRGLNGAFKCALKVEAALDSQLKRPKDQSKGFRSHNYPTVKNKAERERGAIKENTLQKTGTLKPNQSSYTYEQRKELGLCHKCHGKFYPGHQCTGKVMKITADSDVEEDSEEEQETVESEEAEAAEIVE